MNRYRFLVLALTLFIFPVLVFAQANGTSVPAAGQPGVPLSPGETFMRMIPLFVIVFFIFYFLVIRPQERRARAHQTMLEGLTKGTSVVTAGGIIGRVAGMEADYILLEVANDTKIKVERGQIARPYEGKGGTAAQEASSKGAKQGNKQNKRKGKAA